jgi:hypothetical protein
MSKPQARPAFAMGTFCRQALAGKRGVRIEGHALFAIRAGRSLDAVGVVWR